MAGAGPVSPTRVFVLLKARLVVNGVRRMTRSTWARVGFVFSLLFALVAAGVGVGIGDAAGGAVGGYLQVTSPEELQRALRLY